MERMKLNTDIIPISEFRYNLLDSVKKAKEKKRPVMITQNGKVSFVVVGVDDWEEIMEKIDVLMSMKIAEDQIKAGKTESHKTVMKKVWKHINES